MVGQGRGGNVEGRGGAVPRVAFGGQADLGEGVEARGFQAGAWGDGGSWRVGGPPGGSAASHSSCM